MRVSSKKPFSDSRLSDLKEVESNPLQGIVIGFIISIGLWIGIIYAVRELVHVIG